MTALAVVFYSTPAGNAPAWEWLRGLPAAHRHAIGEDLRAVQWRWPLGMPLVRKMGKDLWELRSTIPDGIARLFFTVWEVKIIVLHGFIKKSDKTPDHELETAQRRLKDFTRNIP
jgi:phage-related protein